MNEEVIFQPRYIAYAKEQGNTPEQQLEIDKGSMYKYMLWIEDKLSLMKRYYPEHFIYNALTTKGGELFTEYLLNGELQHMRGIKNYDTKAEKEFKRRRNIYK
jgi:hypothetical protein